MKQPIERRVIIQPGALSRQEAAAYVGVSTTTLDKLVAAGEMPPPRRYKHAQRLVWLRRELDDALEDLAVDGAGPVNEYAGVKF